MQAKSILAVAFLGLGLAVSGASGAALIPASSFVQPNIAMFNTPPLNFTAPAAYTESGATFRAGVPGGILFLFFGILDLASSSQNFPAGLFDVSFAGPERRFGFVGNSATTDITNPTPWTVTQVDFFANADFTGLFESYTTAFTVGTSPTFFGLESAGEFRAVRISLLSAGGGFSPYLDDFRFDNSPEPAGIWLVGAGLAAVLVGSIRRRRRS
jgi:hypothetical protein